MEGGRVGGGEKGRGRKKKEEKGREETVVKTGQVILMEEIFKIVF